MSALRSVRDQGILDRKSRVFCTQRENATRTANCKAIDPRVRLVSYRLLIRTQFARLLPATDMLC